MTLNQEAKDRVSPLRVAVAAFCITVAIVLTIALMGWLLNQQYEHATVENCKQYESVPEAHLDRVPDGCIGQYYEAKR